MNEILWWIGRNSIEICNILLPWYPKTKFYRNQFSLYVDVENLRALKWFVLKQLQVCAFCVGVIVRSKIITSNYCVTPCVLVIFMKFLTYLLIPSSASASKGHSTYLRDLDAYLPKATALRHTTAV
jgi:hypothetical protein